MGREIRMVKADWQHPKNERGHHIPLLGYSFAEAKADWDESAAKWSEGLIRDYATNGWESAGADILALGFDEWIGDEPDAANFMPQWPQAERTHYALYETVSEGTPLSPSFATPEELACWLAEHGEGGEGRDRRDYPTWLRFIQSGRTSMTLMMVGGQFLDPIVAVS